MKQCYKFRETLKMNYEPKFLYDLRMLIDPLSIIIFAEEFSGIFYVSVLIFILSVFSNLSNNLNRYNYLISSEILFILKNLTFFKKYFTHFISPLSKKFLSYIYFPLKSSYRSFVLVEFIILMNHSWPTSISINSIKENLSLFPKLWKI